MSALSEQRQRGQTIGIIGICVALVALLVLAVVGVRTVKTSRAGQSVGTGITYEAEFPYTPTGLIGVVDSRGRIASLAVVTVGQSGLGGTIVVAAPMADAQSGTGEFYDPMDRIYSIQGAQSFVDQAELMTRLSFDVIEVMTPERFASLISTTPSIEVDLPIAVHDSTTKEKWASGSNKVDPKGATAIMTAHDPEIDDWYYLPARSAVWTGLAASVGKGLANDGVDAPVAGQLVTTPKSMDELWQRLTGGPVAVRTLVAQRVPSDLADEHLDPSLLEPGVPASVVVHDRAEMISIFASIASARIGAPNAGARLRIVNPLSVGEVESVPAVSTDSAADDAYWNVASMWKLVIDGLLFSGTNVVSIDVRPGNTPPEITQVEVLNGVLSNEDQDILNVIFGEYEVVPLKDSIQGVDETVILGKSFLRHLAQSKVPTFAIESEATTGDTASGTSGDVGTEPSAVVGVGGSSDSTISDSSTSTDSRTG